MKQDAYKALPPEYQMLYDVLNRIANALEAIVQSDKDTWL